jgi:hypothetical protein
MRNGSGEIETPLKVFVGTPSGYSFLYSSAKRQLVDQRGKEINICWKITPLFNMSQGENA